MPHDPLTEMQEAISESSIKLPHARSLWPLIRSIRQYAEEQADLLSVAGVLLEGTVHLLRQVPHSERKKAVAAVMQLLSDRLTTLDMH